MPSFISVMIFVFLSISCSHAYKYYQDKIPNGHRVIHSCKQSVFWNGVGHKADSGGGALNKFGTEFKAAAYVSCDFYLDSFDAEAACFQL